MKPLGFCERCGYFEGICKCGRGKILIDGEKRKRISKFLSGLLRHYPEKFKVKIDEYGWANVKDVLRILRVDREILELIVRFDPKGRFEMRDDKIRARYGHSIQIKFDWSDKGKIPQKLYHGTSPNNLESILKEGLKPMKRLEVHLSDNLEDAIEVGKRYHSNPVILVIDAKSLINAGFKVRKKGRVYTVDYVPPNFIIEVIKKLKYTTSKS